MGRIRVAVDIDAPPRKVWAKVEDIGSHADWMEDAVAIHFLSDRHSGKGTVFDCDTRVGPFRLTDRMTITRWEPNRCMGVRHEGLVTGEGTFRLRRLRRGRTRFMWREKLRFPLRYGGPIASFVVARFLKRMWRRSLKNLKLIIEAS